MFSVHECAEPSVVKCCSGDFLVFFFYLGCVVHLINRVLKSYLTKKNVQILLKALCVCMFVYVYVMVLVMCVCVWRGL